MGDPGTLLLGLALALAALWLWWTWWDQRALAAAAGRGWGDGAARRPYGGPAASATVARRRWCVLPRRRDGTGPPVHGEWHAVEAADSEAAVGRCLGPLARAVGGAGFVTRVDRETGRLYGAVLRPDVIVPDLVPTPCTHPAALRLYLLEAPRAGDGGR